MGGKSLFYSAVERQWGIEENGEANLDDDGIISPSRFSVLARKGFEDNDENDDDEKGEDIAEGEEIDEGEVIAKPQKVDTKLKDSSKSVRFRAETSLKLSKQIPAWSKDAKVVKVNTNTNKTSTQKL